MIQDRADHEEDDPKFSRLKTFRRLWRASRYLCAGKDLITWHEAEFLTKIGGYALTSRRPGYGSWRSVSQQAGCDHVPISQGHRCNVCGVTTIKTSGQQTSSIAVGNAASAQPLLQ